MPPATRRGNGQVRAALEPTSRLILRGGLASLRPLFGSDTHPRPGRPYTTSGRIHTLAGISLVPRNSPCLCGSGKKYKRCCLDRERELPRKCDALEELVGLGSMFPLLRPDCPEFDAWAATRQTDDVTRELIEEGGALLPEVERERIARAHAQEFPDVWRSLVGDLGDQAAAEQAAVIGAIVAALAEADGVDPTALALIERASEELGDDPAETLALALDPTDLWSIAEATAAGDAVAEIPDALDDDAYEVLWTAALEAEAARLWSQPHERRLARLVERLRKQLPFAASATASAVLTEACAAYASDENVRTRLAALLLADSLGALRQAQTLAAVAA